MIKNFKNITKNIKIKEKLKNKKAPLLIRQRRKINTLQGEIDVLKEEMKNELYTKITNDISLQLENDRLLKENKRLRIKNKELKKELN